jgi:hypothetical protein
VGKLICQYRQSKASNLNKVEVPRFIFLNRFSPGLESELRVKNYGLRIETAPNIILFIPAMVKTTIRIKVKVIFSSFNKSRLSLPKPNNQGGIQNKKNIIHK